MGTGGYSFIRVDWRTCVIEQDRAGSELAHGFPKSWWVRHRDYWCETASDPKAQSRSVFHVGKGELVWPCCVEDKFM